jgi:hypothetical protein
VLNAREAKVWRRDGASAELAVSTIDDIRGCEWLVSVYRTTIRVVHSVTYWIARIEHTFDVIKNSTPIKNPIQSLMNELKVSRY